MEATNTEHERFKQVNMQSSLDEWIADFERSEAKEEWALQFADAFNRRVPCADCNRPLVDADNLGRDMDIRCQQVKKVGRFTEKLKWALVQHLIGNGGVCPECFFRRHSPHTD